MALDASVQHTTSELKSSVPFAWHVRVQISR